jgi:predicted ArsR family transcriptional regulator
MHSMMPMMHQTRRHILELLRTRTGQTVSELSASLHLTRTAVLNHLATLQADGLVIRRGLRPGKRRPSIVYEVTPSADAAFPKTYDAFAADVLQALRDQGPATVGRTLRRVEAQWIARDLPRVQKLRGRARTEMVSRILAERGFLPTLQSDHDGYVLREHNCPVMRLAIDYLEVCDTIHRWMEALFGTSLRRTHCMRRGEAFSEYHFRAS